MGRYQPLHKSDKFKIKCKHTVHFKDRSFLPLEGQVLIPFFFKTKLNNIILQHRSLDIETITIHARSNIREILQRSSKHKTEVLFIIILRLTEVLNTIKNAKSNTSRSH